MSTSTRNVVTSIHLLNDKMTFGTSLPFVVFRQCQHSLQAFVICTRPRPMCKVAACATHLRPAMRAQSSPWPRPLGIRMYPLSTRCSRAVHALFGGDGLFLCLGDVSLSVPGPQYRYDFLHGDLFLATFGREQFRGVQGDLAHSAEAWGTILVAAGGDQCFSCCVGFQAARAASVDGEGAIL